MKKRLNLISEVSEWNWEINNDHHAADLFATRLSAIHQGCTPKSPVEQIHDLLDIVEKHRLELQQIKDQLVQLGTKLMQTEENPELLEMMNDLRNRVSFEINEFANVKHEYFRLMRNILFSAN